MSKESVDIEGKNVNMVEAEFMNIVQSTVRSVEGGHIELQQVGAFSIDGERVEVTQGASVIMRGDTISLNQSIGGVVTGNSTNLNFSFTPFSVSTEGTVIEKSAVGIMAAKEIKSEDSTAVIMIGKNINGNVTTLLDWKSALAISAVAGGIFGLFSLLRKGR
jgi:NDP-sugar pyrophosphorylase family protein